jgi:hypothetical protein
MTRNDNGASPLAGRAARAAGFAALAYVFTRAWMEAYQVAWGTGHWLGEFSLKWAGLMLALTVLGLIALAAVAMALWRAERYSRLAAGLAALRQRLGVLRLALAAMAIAAVIWFFQYTSWGIVFDGTYARLVVWTLAVVLVGTLIERSRQLLGWTSTLAAITMTGASFSFAAAMTGVTAYPFSLGWSEGNRLWDYSIMFGRALYDYPADQPMPVLLDPGRQLIGGLPFLIPDISIAAARFWLGLTVTIPYVLLGLAAFRSQAGRVPTWLLAGLWAMLFLRQGPIHPPLVFCALFTALLWRSNLLVAVPLIALTGYLAEESRFTWLFAPGLWIGTLELSGARSVLGKITARDWVRAIGLGAAGAMGGYFGPRLASLMAGQAAAGVSLSPAAVAGYAADQPLLLYRLLPNATYGIGILVGLLIAIGPLVAVLINYSRKRDWSLVAWQRLAIILPLLVFLVVGLVVSTKIGGGGDLHNMDMFLIALFFVAALAFRTGAGIWLQQVEPSAVWLRSAVVVMLLLPAFEPLMSMRTIQPVQDLVWLRALTDAEPNDSFDLLPSADRVEQVLGAIRSEVALARNSGEILFMDQRQLLTFGEVRDVPFVPEYEKKILMNDALGGTPHRFRSLYADLTAKRFSLIVTEPLRAPVKDSTYQFGEENNAWVKWVVNPVLCYYEARATFKDVQIELLVPRQGNVDCAPAIPPEVAGP